MKFVRRPDLDSQTRIHIVMLAWLHHGVYGKRTEIANYYQISRTFLYQLLLAANLQLAVLFSDAKFLFQKDHQHFEHLLLLLRLEGHCSLLSIASILKALEYYPNSVGSLSQFFHSAGQTLPSTLLMSSKKVVFYLSDEIMKSSPSTRPFWSLSMRKAPRSSPSSWPQIARLTPGERIVKPWSSTISSALVWPRIEAWASSPATRPRTTWPWGWRIISTSFATSSRCCINWSAKPLPPLARKTTRPGSWPVPQASPIFTRGSTRMKRPITPVSRPWHSTTNAPCCSTCCVKPGNYARLMADCAPSKTSARHSRCFST